MYMKFNLWKYCLSFLTLFISLVSVGQNNEVQNYTELIQSAECVVEGKIVASESYWDRQHRNIYTSYSIEVGNILKGSAEEQITVTVKGGKVDQTWQLVVPSVELQVGEAGVFLVNKETEDINSLRSGCNYTLTYGDKSVFLFSDNHSTPERIEQNTDSFFKIVETVSGKLLHHTFVPDNLKSAEATQVVDSIYPRVLTAGTDDIISIAGSGFGNEQNSSKVWFKLSDRPEYIFSNDVFKYITWTDTLIQLYVPYKAASGTIAVEVNNKKMYSSQSITIRYACTNDARTNDPVYMINANGLGGYSWRMNSNLSTYSQAKDIVTQSVNDWICATSVPWRIGGDVKSVEGKDGESTISFGPVTNSIDVMGLASLFMSNHPVDGNDVWILEEVDITLSDANDWCFTGDCSGSDKYDFKTVVMHQLAHALLIDHVNTPGDLMYYSLGKGEIRDLGLDNIECAEYNLNKSAELNHPDYMTINPYQFEPPVVNRNEDTLSTSYVFNSYQWYDTDGLIPGATESVYVATKTGEYYLEGINEFGCAQVSEAVEVFITNNHSTTGEVLLYPNPMKEELHIEYATPFTEAIFFNTLGQKILRVQLDPENTKTTFHLGNLPAGVYSVWLISNEEKVRRKFVVY